MNDAERRRLRGLLMGGPKDRAFLDGSIRLRWARTIDPHERDELRALHRALLASGRLAHLAQHAELRAGTLRGDALRHVVEAVPIERRDHFVEEMLGIAYPPLDEAAVAREQMPYLPSGYDEIVHAVETTKLRAGERFVDVGSGMGKVVMLATLLTGADAIGIEQDRALHDCAIDAARVLGLASRFVHADAMHADVAEADVVFMYIPFTGGTFVQWMTQASSWRDRWLCASAIDLTRHPTLTAVGEPRSWLQTYHWHGRPTVEA